MDEYAVCLADKAWRMTNLYWIKNKEGKRVKFTPNRAQRRFIRDRHGRDVILKCRQRGFTTLIQIDMLDECLFTPNTNAGVIAHNRDDAQAFFKDKIKYAYDNIAPHIKASILASNDAAGELRFENGSVIRVGTSLRSGTFQYLHISEYGKICAKYPEKAEEVRTGALPAVPRTGRVVIESTAEGRMGHFYELSDEGLKRAAEGVDPMELEYKTHFFPWWDAEEYISDPLPFTPIRWVDYFEGLTRLGIKTSPEQQSWYIQEAKTLGDKMKREHPSTPEEAFEAAIEGAFWAKEMAQLRAKNQICRVPIDPVAPIHTFWDLGRDGTVCWFFQAVGFEWRFIDYVAGSNEGMMYYISILKARMDGETPYNYGDCYLPHDGTRKGMLEGSAADLLYENGFSVRLVERTPRKTDSIERAALAIPQCWFDRDKCEDGIKALDAYRHEWDDKLGTWREKPLHDWASHGGDAFMTFADGYYHTSVVEEEAETVLRDRGRNAITGY